MQDNWIEVVDYYRQIGGKHVAVFIAINKQKYMILEATIDGRVMLVDKDNNIVLEDYDLVTESRKMFYYIEEPIEIEHKLPEEIKKLRYSNNNILTLIENGGVI
nr:MAG TPA: hypothetical protein [Herelleviridae sp.]